MGKPYSQLTARGRAGRLLALARAALARYDLKVRRVRLLANHLNGLFRVDTADGSTYALRVSHPTWRSHADLRAELLWLQALHRDTDIGAPVPVLARCGELAVTVGSDGVPEPRRCLLMTWLPGVDLATRLCERSALQLGQLSAHLHAHAAAWEPPAGFAARGLTGLYARGEPDLLLHESARDAVPAAARAVLAQATRQVAAAHTSLASGPPPHAIHADLNQGNVKTCRGRLRPLDFEDTAWGHPVQDIAATFGDLLFYTELTNEGYLRLRDAFTGGYCSRRAWPEAHPGQIDTFMAGRLIWRANHAVQHQRRRDPAGTRRFTAWVAARLREFLDSGVLRK